MGEWEYCLYISQCVVPLPLSWALMRIDGIVQTSHTAFDVTRVRVSHLSSVCEWWSACEVIQNSNRSTAFILQVRVYMYVHIAYCICSTVANHCTYSVGNVILYSGNVLLEESFVQTAEEPQKKILLHLILFSSCNRPHPSIFL